MKTGRADTRRLPAVLLVCLLLVTATGCRSAGPRLSAAELKALMERNRQAQELFQQALAAGADPKRQEDLYRQAIGLVHDLGKAHNNLGLLLLDQERYEEAMPELREAVKELPESAEPRFNLGYAYELIGRLPEAEDEYAGAVRLSPQEPDYLESLARVYIKRQASLGRARSLLERALAHEVRPDNVTWIHEQFKALDTGPIP